MKHSKRAGRVWERLEQVFGAALNAAYPLGMSESMAAMVDAADDDSIKNGLAKLKAMRRPPSLVEFQAALQPAYAQTQAKPNIMPMLVAYATKNLPLTQRQVRSPWTFLYQGDARGGSLNFFVSGVRIPADEEEGRPELVVSAEVLHG